VHGFIALNGDDSMHCLECDKEKKIVARGYCGACYDRKRKNGSLDRKYVIDTGRCSMPGCSNASFAKNLCSLHYARQIHPLMGFWRTFKANNFGYPPEWERFDCFLADVGEKKSVRDKLLRRDQDKPHSKGNSYWHTPGPNERKDYFTPEERSAYVRDWTLKRKFGISSAKYEEIKKSQGGRCAICRGEESFINKRSGVLQELSVDHCHDMMHVRGLLCVRCNRMLGYARDDVGILRSAIDYLEHHNSLVTSDPPPEG
jgi:hypothetical protein